MYGQLFKKTKENRVASTEGASWETCLLNLLFKMEYDFKFGFNTRIIEKKISYWYCLVNVNGDSKKKDNNWSDSDIIIFNIV